MGDRDGRISCVIEPGCLIIILLLIIIGILTGVC